MIEESSKDAVILRLVEDRHLLLQRIEEMEKQPNSPFLRAAPLYGGASDPISLSVLAAESVELGTALVPTHEYERLKKYEESLNQTLFVQCGLPHPVQCKYVRLSSADYNSLVEDAFKWRDNYKNDAAGDAVCDPLTAALTHSRRARLKADAELGSLVRMMPDQTMLVRVDHNTWDMYDTTKDPIDLLPPMRVKHSPEDALRAVITPEANA